MAQSYDRRINLYINVDGKDIQNNVQSIRGELQKLVNQQNKMTIGSEEYIKQTAKIKQLNSILAQHRAGLKEIETPLQKVIGFAKNLAPAFGFTALAAGAKYAFGQIVNSTDVLSTKWAIFTGGLKSGLNEFWRTIATGDWSGFLTNFKEAVRVGREYEEILDRVEEKTRALKIAEAESRAEELRLEEMLRNKTLSKAERIKAGQDRIKLEEDLSKQRVKVAQDTFDAELAVTMQQTRLSKERLMEVVSDLDSETKAKAQAYNEQLEIYESAQKRNDQVQAGLSRGGVSSNPFAEQMAKSKAILDSYPDSVKQYAEALRGVGSTTDQQLDKMVSAYEGLLSAQNSAAENTRRVRTQVYSLLAGEKEDKPGDPADPEEYNKEALKAIEYGYKEQQLFLQTRYANEETLQKEFHARMLANELAYILARQELSNDDLEYIELQQQYNSKLTEYQAIIKETVPEILATRDAIDGLNSRLLEESKLLAFATQKQNEGTEAQEAATSKQMRQADTIKMVGDVMTDYVTGALNGSLDNYQTFGDTLILMSLDILKQMVPIWAAQILGLSLSSPESVATWGVAGMAKYAVVTGLMYAGIAAVEGAVKSNINKRKEKTKGYALGGYASEEQYIVAEKNKPEWIAPNWMLQSPITAPMIASLEQMRRNRYTVNPEIIKQFAGSSSRRAISPAISFAQQPGGAIATNNSEINNSLVLALQENTKAVKKLMDWTPSVAVETYEKKRLIYEDITKNRGL